MKKIKVGIIFGGKSAEHEVSLQSAKNVVDALDREKYEPILIGIDPSGQWSLSHRIESIANAGASHRIELGESSPSITFTPESNGHISRAQTSPEGFQSKESIDVAFPILHGPMGEDGTVQGFLKLANIPFVGSGVLGSAVGMDKDVMKRLLRDAGIPIGKFITLTEENEVPPFNQVVERLGLPFFVKPANMGSSVGVSKVQDESGYHAATKLAFSYDVKILIEEMIEGREIECSVLGNKHPIASVIGEIVPTHDFYSYDAKYLDEHGASLIIPAKIPEEVSRNAQKIALASYRTLAAEGMGRIDMFLKNNGEIFVNEINTIPGFTKISMYPKLWEASGLSYRDLIDQLIQLALERFEREKKLKTSYR